jgi:hypothetical protein
MAYQVAIWNTKVELEELVRKVSKLKEEEKVCPSFTLVPRAAIKEAGWDEGLIEEAIERGRAIAKGEEVGEAPWKDLERESGGSSDDEVPEAPEIPGLETTEKEPAKPGRVFNLLGDMGGEESEGQEEVREKESKDPLMHRDPQTPEEHVNYLNRIHIMRTDNPQWEDFLWTYMKTHGLKPSDMEGLVGPRPWKDDPLWANTEDEEIPEPPYAGIGLAKEKILEAAARETVAEYDKKMFDEFFGPIKEEEAMETEVTKESLTEKMAQHLVDRRRKVIVGSEIGWLCEKCNSVWSLEQQICSNRCRKAEPPTVEHRGWPKEEGSGLVADVRFPEEEAGDPLAADPDLLIKYDPAVLRQHMEKHLLHGGHKVEDKKAEMEERMKKALGVETLPGDPEPCPLCDAMDGELCGCCHTCEEQKCKCCELCNDFPCICDSTEECPICEKRIVIGEACPTGCDADTIELAKLYEEVKNDKSLNFEEKVRYMSLLKEKMNFAQNEEVDEQMPEPETFDEDEYEDE